ncbi:ANL_collapsed_G0029760.mRNA.1.CDS.1 [Saccharomyces cerevisiae]|nr:ANL_collapsed_G0029760.mRNA.1.CDS.1 [Saccharomyces cerevisiae]
MMVARKHYRYIYLQNSSFSHFLLRSFRVSKGMVRCYLPVLPSFALLRKIFFCQQQQHATLCAVLRSGLCGNGDIVPMPARREVWVWGVCDLVAMAIARGCGLSPNGCPLLRISHSCRVNKNTREGGRR